MKTGMLEIPERPLAIFMIPPPALYGLSFALGVLLQHTLALPGWTLTGAPKVAGIAVLVCAIGCGAALALTFLVRRTTLNPFASPAVFIAYGPYRFTRNPMYVTLTVAYCAGIVLYGSLWPVLTLLIPVLVLDRIVIPFEECRMSSMFGEGYEAYKARVRRWL